MLVYFLRHASAGTSLDDLKKDEKRPLDEEGILQCRYVGKALAALDVSVEHLVTSPLKRATQTASLVANEIGFEGKIATAPELRPEATYDQFREMLRRYSNGESIMVVGHNPNLAQFLGNIISSRASSASIDFKKGAIAKVEAHGRTGALHWLLTPRAVRAIYTSATSSSRPKTSRK
jgi:phosphohistidine phosphatase